MNNMSILKFVDRTPKTISQMYTYLTDPEKTDIGGIFGIGINPRMAVEEINFAQLVYYRDKLEHPYIQIIFSFDKNLFLSLATLRKICMEIGYVLMPDERQVLGAIHYKETNHIHCHYILNYVGIQGNLYRQKYSVKYYKERVNEILASYKLTEIIIN